MATSRQSESNLEADAQLSREAQQAPSAPNSPSIGLLGWLRWTWRQLTSMRTALILLLLLAAAAIPGSVYPQRSADPNGVTQFFQQQPDLAAWLDKAQLFDVYSSTWFSAIYLLLFISLIGCVVPRTLVHAKALLAKPVSTPANLARMPAYRLTELSEKKAAKLDSGKKTDLLHRGFDRLKRQGYRVERQGDSVSAERGFLRETGNLVFHIALIGVLFAVGFGGAYSFSGQRVLVVGDTFVNNLAGYDSFSPGPFFNQNELSAFRMTLTDFQSDFDIRNPTNRNTPLDFRAYVTSQVGLDGTPKKSVIRVNYPLEMPNASVYLTGNGFAPVLTFKDASGKVSFSGPVIYLPQDENYTSLGVIKLPDAKPKQFGVLSFFYPVLAQLPSGAFTSRSPIAGLPDTTAAVSMSVYVGNLGLDSGVPQNVFTLNVHGLKQVAGGKAKTKGIVLVPGQTAVLPDGLGTVKFERYLRFASLDISYNPAQGWVLFFALLALAGLITSLLVPRRRVWIRRTANGFEVAALARGDDPLLDKVVEDLSAFLGSKKSAKVRESATAATKIPVKKKDKK